MRYWLKGAFVGAVTFFACGCSMGSPSGPSQNPIPETITFNELSGLSCVGVFPTSPSCAISEYKESGFTTSARSGDWFVRTDYGNPRPFIQFVSAASTTVDGEIRITASSTFTFTSVDLYSSTTPITYRITGLRNSASLFQLSDTVPTTFGNFTTITSPTPSIVIDTLSIALTNVAAACCRNPAGLDTIVLAK